MERDTSGLTEVGERNSRLRALRIRALRAFLQLAPNERNRVFILTVVIGGVCGLAAVAFHASIRFATHLFIDRSLSAPGNGWIVWSIVTPTLGAVVAGLLLQYVIPNARGSGIPQLKFVYAVKSGRLRLRDAVGKFFVASLQLGTGSALGREGPTVQICASIASALGRMFALSPNNLRRLLPVGAAAGIAAAFNAPIAAVTFTIEEVVGDLDQTVLSGVVVAAALAAVVEHSVLGEHPVFNVPGTYGLEHASSLLVYACLGVAAALLARVFCGLLLSLRATITRDSTVPGALKPAIGGFATGALAVLLSLTLGAQGVLGDGYVTLSAALVGEMSLRAMIALALAKLLATVLCYASGGAGGIFAPVLFIGGMLGGAFGHLDRAVLLHPDAQLGAFALVGMGAFFAAVIRAPITSVLIIFEMTRGYGLILPLMIANTAAYVLARRWHAVPIYEALLDQDGMHLPQAQRAAAALSAYRVSDAMTTELVALRDDERVSDALERIRTLGYSVYPVIDSEGLLRGMVSEARLRRSSVDGRGELAVSNEMRSERYLESDTALVEAVAAMNARGVRQTAVVRVCASGPQLVGMLAMSDVMRAYSRAAEATADDSSPEDGSSARPAVRWKSRDTSTSIPHAPPEPPK